MKWTQTSVRASVSALFFVICFVFLFWVSSGNSFCFRPEGPSHLAQTFRLSLACTAWQYFSVWCCESIQKRVGRGASVPFSGLIALLGFASIPFWIVGAGGFMFEDTFADVSCFFTEGYGMMFPIIEAPLLALATICAQLLIPIPRTDPEDELTL
jgi:hypothetical protein